MWPIAKSLSHVRKSPTVAINDMANAMRAAGQDVISLAGGEPDFETPDWIADAGIRAIRDGKTKYTAVDGTRELKKAICEKLQRENGVHYTPSEISVSAGAKQAIFNVLAATIDPADEVIIGTPCWVSYPDIARLLGGTPVFVAHDAYDNFALNADRYAAAITKKTKWIILNSPNNPTGAVASREELRGLADVLLDHPHVHALTDDIYEHLVYEKEFATLAAVEPRLRERIVLVNGLSKSYAMTGWRIGYAAASKQIVQAMATVQSQSTTNPSSISQAAAVAALSGKLDVVIERKLAFKSRRDLVACMLNATQGLACSVPKGAFYVFPDCSGCFGKIAPDGRTIANDVDLATYLLCEWGIAVVPGSAFGAGSYFRMSYAASAEILREACTRIQKACASLSN